MKTLLLARYLGAGLNDPRHGRFTNGKLYLAKPRFEDEGAIDLSSLLVSDDNGREFDVAGSRGLWEFPGKAYGVFLKNGGGASAGTVVEVLEASSDGFFKVLFKGRSEGWMKSDEFELLDSTSLRPGNYVLDLGGPDPFLPWVRVARVDGAGWISTEREPDRFRSPTEFRFPVSDGFVAAEPLVRCVDATGVPYASIKHGVVYRICSENPRSGMVMVDGGDGELMECVRERFETDL
jgi:hypothetical protein